MTLMTSQREVSPHTARDAAGFVEAMKQLKDQTGLTYRQLEEQAARNGDVLARSTLADILRRSSLPRPDVLAAFVRACGEGQHVGSWLDARERIAVISPAASGTKPGASGESEGDAGIGALPETEEPTTSRQGQRKGRTLAVASVLVIPLLGAATWGLLSRSSHDSGDPSALARTPADGWVTIRPARNPDLCLTDGRDRGGAYASAVAVQLACAHATVPRTYLEPAGGGMYRIQWHHPQEGKGCLTVMSTGPVKGMLEPRNDCTHATLFRLEPAANESAGVFRLRPSTSGRCIGIVHGDTAEGAEAVEERCTRAADQQFLVRTSGDAQ
ncbi:RICIN domain-containing protein [Streptomyces canarius]